MEMWLNYFLYKPKIPPIITRINPMRKPPPMVTRPARIVPTAANNSKMSSTMNGSIAPNDSMNSVKPKNAMAFSAMINPAMSYTMNPTVAFFVFLVVMIFPPMSLIHLFYSF